MIQHAVRILVLIFVCGISALGMDLDFKLSGGYSYLVLNDINSGVADWIEWRKREAEANKNWQYLGQEVGNLHSGIHLEGELLFSFSDRFGVSLGTGYVYSDIGEKEVEVLVQKVSGTTSQIITTTASAYPLVLSGYYFLPLKTRLRFYLRGGGGIVWAKYVHREAKKAETSARYNYFQLNRASATGPIFLGSIGIIYETEVGVRFFLEGLVRMAKIQGFSGENQLEEKGRLYYFEEYHPELDFWQKKNEVRTEMPSGENIRSVSETVVDFSGFSVKIGFIVRF